MARWWIALCLIAITGCRWRFNERAVDGGNDDVLFGDVSVDVMPDAFVCTTPMQLASDFSTSSGAWVASIIAGSGVIVSDDTGELAIALSAPDASPRYGYYTSRCPYDMRGHDLTVEVIGTPQQILGIEMGIVVSNLGITLQANMLSAFSNYAGFMEHARVGFDPTLHRYWRMREVAGTVAWEYSQDRTAWTVLFSQANPVSWNGVHPQIYSGSFVATGTPGTARFDNAD